MLLGSILWFVVRKVRRISAKGAAHIAREEARVRATAAAPPAAVRHIERHVEREKIIERQIVVTHCKFCKELTPVDLSECKSCGATIK